MPTLPELHAELLLNRPAGYLRPRVLPLATCVCQPAQWVHAQVRQHVEHKRTFFYLEQLILKHNADTHCLSVKEIHEVHSYADGKLMTVAATCMIGMTATGKHGACRAP